MQKAVTYTAFGAKGDGITDDFAAICAAHDYANAHGLPVVTDDGKTYLIRETMLAGQVRTAIIRTDVTWGSSRIIIDDTEISDFDGTARAASPIFKIESDVPTLTLNDPTLLEKLLPLDENKTALPLSLGYAALVIPYDDAHTVYRRYGADYIARGGQASPKNEVLLLDAAGNIDPSTPLMFTYDHLTRIEVIRADLAPLTVHGGTFITRASRCNAIDPDTQKRSRYIQRNLLVNRSNTVLDGVMHYVENEMPLEDLVWGERHGAHYWGFFHVTRAQNVTLKSCILTGRRSYRYSTYEFIADHVNRIRLVDCSQSNFWLQDENGNMVGSMSPSPLTNWPRCWGIGGTNFCKNMEYEGCTLSRFDAHQGLYNGKISNSTINFMEVVGKGELTLENVTWHSPAPGAVYNSFVYLREDFGSTWDGTIALKNCTFHVSEGDANVFFYKYTNWDYGYRCHFPNLVIEDPTICGLTPGAKLHLVWEKGSIDKEVQMHLPHTQSTPPKDPTGKEHTSERINLNPVVPPKFIKIHQSHTAYAFCLPKCEFFKDTEKIGVAEE